MSKKHRHRPHFFTTIYGKIRRPRHQEECWIVLKEPERRKPYFAITTLRWTRKDTIDAFMVGTGMSWKRAKKLYRVRVVKVLMSEMGK